MEKTINNSIYRILLLAVIMLCGSMASTARAADDDVKVTKSDIKELKDVYKNLQEQEQELIQEISEKQAVLNDLMRAQRLQEQLNELQQVNEELEREKKSLEDDYKSKEQVLASLDTIRQGVANSFVEKNKDYLERAFSKMDSKELQRLKEASEKYDAQFASKIDKAIGFKALFDSVVAVVNQKYDPVAINNAKELTKQLMNSGLNEVQSGEVNTLIGQLAGFKKGLDTLKEFIIKLNDRRQFIQIKKEFNEEVNLILSDKDKDGNTLKSRIESEVKTIPYLENAYRQFSSDWQKAQDFTKKLEQEILEQ